MTKPLIKTQPIAEPWDLYPTAYQSIKQQQKKLRGTGSLENLSNLTKIRTYSF